MRRAALVVIPMMLSLAGGGVVGAQVIPTTVAAAEAEGAVVPHASAPSVWPVYFTHNFGGTTERRCVETQGTDLTGSGSVRSGDFIVRGWQLLTAGDTSKLLWAPVHDPGSAHVTVRLRAARLDHPADTLRLEFPGVVRSPSRARPSREFGFISLVSFPTPGRWLVVATSRNDWGCFLVDVTK